MNWQSAKLTKISLISQEKKRKEIASVSLKESFCLKILTSWDDY